MTCLERRHPLDTTRVKCRCSKAIKCNGSNAGMGHHPDPLGPKVRYFIRLAVVLEMVFLIWKDSAPKLQCFLNMLF